MKKPPRCPPFNWCQQTILAVIWVGGAARREVLCDALNKSRREIDSAVNGLIVHGVIRADPVDWNLLRPGQEIAVWVTKMLRAWERSWSPKLVASVHDRIREMMSRVRTNAAVASRHCLPANLLASASVEEADGLCYQDDLGANRSDSPP